MNRILMAVIALSVIGCAGSKKMVEKGEISKTIEQDSVRKSYIESIGIGAADATLSNTTQRRATSRNAAIVAAQYEMLSMVKGIDLEGGIKVQRAVETDSLLQTRIDAAIRGAEIVRSEWTNDDGCLVTLRLDRKRLEQLMGVKFK